MPCGYTWRCDTPRPSVRVPLACIVNVSGRAASALRWVCGGTQQVVQTPGSGRHHSDIAAAHDPVGFLPRGSHDEARHRFMGQFRRLGDPVQALVLEMDVRFQACAMVITSAMRVRACVPGRLWATPADVW